MVVNQFLKIDHFRKDAPDLDSLVKNVAQNWKVSEGFSDASLFAGSNFDIRMLGWVGKAVFEDWPHLLERSRTPLISALLLENLETLIEILELERSHYLKNPLEHINTVRWQSPSWRLTTRELSTIRFQRGGSRSTFLHGLHSYNAGFEISANFRFGGWRITQKRGSKLRTD